MTRQLIIFWITLLSCGAAFSQTWVIDSIYHQNKYRYYRAYLPASYTGASPWPVVLTLHGGGGNALGFVSFTQMNMVADTANFIAVYPQGTQVGSNCCSWAAGIGSPADTSGIDDIDFFNKLIDTLTAQLNIDTNRIYSTGLSQGGFMSHRLACELNNRIAAVAPLCSNLDSLQMRSCNPARPVSVFVINGTSDLKVPYNGATIVNNGYPLTFFPTDTLMQFWAKKNGCSDIPISQNLPNTNLTDNSTITKFIFNNCSCNVQTVLYRVNGGGHTWPGVENKIYELIAGETNEDVHASVEIWNFLKNHSLECTSTTGLAGDNELQKSIIMFPNPADNTIFISNSLNQSVEIKIYDLVGNLILTTKIDKPICIIDISFLNAGLYFISDGLQGTKIIKR